MASLHKVTEETKTAFKWGLIGIATIILLLFLFRIGRNIKEHFFPTPPPPPTVSFGKLPAVLFPQNAIDQKLSYTIDTISGNLPTFPDKIAVYPLEQPTPNFLNLSRAQEKAERINFPKQGTALSNTSYLWVEQESPYRKLIMDIVSFNFSLTSDYATNPALLQENSAPDPTTAITQATDFLNGLSLLPNDIDTTKTTTKLLRVTDQLLIPATSPSTAQLTQVNFFQNDVDKLPVYYTNPPNSSLSFLLTQNGNNPEILAATFTHFTIDLGTSATYPIQSAKKAFEALQKGNAYIAVYPQGQNNIHIKDVRLGYYLGDTTQKYLWPIIVFQGDNFFAYVPAVTDAWVQTLPSQK